jgi:cellulose synthase operon protein C
MREKRSTKLHETNERDEKCGLRFGLLRVISWIAVIVFLAIATFDPPRDVHAGKAAETNIASSDEKEKLIESALYTRVEFFGAQALMPYPTAEARNRLAALQNNYPNDPQIELTLSQLDEKLGRVDDAQKEMRAFVDHAPDKLRALETMAAFLNRRAQFDAQAETLERMMQIAPTESRVEIFRKLIDLAQAHALEKYLAPAFYQQTLAQNESAFEILDQYAQKLIDQKNYRDALNVVRQYKPHFPDRRDLILEKEVSILDEMGQAKEAEAAYIKAFDPFWPDDVVGMFYDFLKEHDRFRAYGHELRAVFQRNPSNFDTAVRLIHYGKYAGDESSDIFVQLEKSRAARHIVWKQDELVTITRLLIANNYADAASRFLYTLYLQGEMKPGSPLRAKILYQLFELLSDAGEERLALTHGDLKFYEDIAQADPHPGMLGGILSLILSDTDPKEKFQLEEDRAVQHFNRAAAYRIFTAYKQEYPTAPELAQMYLDIVRLYTTTKETAVAAATLAEFEKRYTDAPRYPEVALKLADCYIAAGKYEEERALYQRVLDYLGQHRQQGAALLPSSEHPANSPGAGEALSIDSEPTDVKPLILFNPSSSNPGIQIPEEETGNNYDYSNARYTDYLTEAAHVSYGRGRRRSSAQVKQANEVDYATVLDRYVASLAKDNRTADILALYSKEIQKYDNEQGLYERRLQCLGQTNMVDEQLRVYQEALKKFPTTTWRDRLARWFVRQKRDQEFETFSRDLLAKVNDKEAENYLHKFVDARLSATSFDANFYLGLYTLAHQRFPHNLNFVSGLLKYYSAHDRWPQWRALVAEYYFESREIRNQFLSQLASHNELRDYFARARELSNQNSQQDVTAPLPYKLFRADAAVWLSNYEEAIGAYRELNRLYPNTPEFAERLINFTRSLGQHNRKSLAESAAVSHAVADAFPSSLEYRTRAGEIQAELGDYAKARAEWEQLIPIARGEPATYLDSATLYWDYFQYDDALRTIRTLRRQTNDETLYAFQAGVILEDKHQLREALTEYIKALADNGTDYKRVGDIARARKRLVTLSKRPGVLEQIEAAFNQERRRNDNWEFIWEYADFLNDAKHWITASTLLRKEILRSDSQKFLRRARDLFEQHKETDAQVAALKRLIDTAPGQRLAISYRLQLAGVFDSNGQRAEAANVLRALVQNYPTNYGVLSESADFYWRLGLRADSLAVLRSGMQRGIGRFHYIFGRKLATREIEMDHLAAAEAVLRKLHNEDRVNTEVVHELARLYVRMGNRGALRTTFRTTLEAIKKQDLDISEIRADVAELRAEMIEAFTRLKDYASAVEQHIEIINRNPDDEEKLDAAINYVKRYGGGDTLLNYYLRTAAQAYKNYRWNVVLARIYEAKGDLANAAKQYRAAIDNQPEMLELYDALAAIHTRERDYDLALTALNKAAELSNDDPQYIKRIIDVLEKAGRHREADLARQKLPREEQKKLSVGDQFAEAARLRMSEKRRAIATYREAFKAFSADPFKHDLKAWEITGYVQTVRDEEPLDQIMRRLWELRSRMTAESERVNNQDAGKARAILFVLDSAVPEAVGGVAQERATGDELSALFAFLNQQIQSAPLNDKDGTLSFLQSLSRRSGFGSLEEKILITQKDSARGMSDWTSYHVRVGALVDLYSERGAYKQIVELLEAERVPDPARDDFEYLRLIAEYTRLIGDGDRELQALRENYQRPGTKTGVLATGPDPLIDRYFAALHESGEAGRNELLSCAQNPTWHQLQLANFLLAIGERELAHMAIEKTPLSVAWKLSRNAEASLTLREFDAGNENYFLGALQFRPIGELVQQEPDTNKQLVGDDWFQLSQTYGQWLYSSDTSDRKLKSDSFLPAMIENRPHDINEQARLGRWYLERKDAEHALEHLRLARESAVKDKRIDADLGSALFLLGRRPEADGLWEEIVSDEPSLEDCELYLRTLGKHGLADQARKRLTTLLLKRLENLENEDEYQSDEGRKEFQQMKTFIRALAESFADSVEQSNSGRGAATSPANESARAVFFRTLCEASSGNVFLPAFLIKESLVARTKLGPFYQILIKRSSGLTSYDRDSDYIALQEKAFDSSSIEEALDHEKDYKPSEPESAKIRWQREYLEYLLKQNQVDEAHRVITTIEAEINHRYARPAWLRLATFRLEIREGRIAQALAGLEHFIGVRTGDNLAAIKAPSMERLNDATALLRSEGRYTEARNLIEAAYAREVALERFEPSYFVGLAGIAFDRGDAALGLKWLQSMVNLSKEELKAETAAELAALPIVKAHAVTASGVELPSGDRGIEQSKALRLAAETAGEFAQFEPAISYRQQLRVLAPDDEENRIELVRSLAATRRTNEAIEGLSAIIGDRTASRSLRWQAVWLAPETTEQKPELWNSLRERVRALNSTDGEMAAALESLSLEAAGRTDDAVKAISAAEGNDPNPYLISLRAILEKKQAHDWDSLNTFTRALIADSESSAWQSFAFLEDQPLQQIIRLYLKQNQPRAALKLAERVADWQRKHDSEQVKFGLNGPGTKAKNYLTLHARAEARVQSASAELLERLSNVAEQIGDLDRAIDFEKARLALLVEQKEREAVQSRVDRLQQLRKKAARQTKPQLVVDQRLVAAQ